MVRKCPTHGVTESSGDNQCEHSARLPRAEEHNPPVNQEEQQGRDRRHARGAIQAERPCREQRCIRNGPDADGRPAIEY